MQQQIWTTLEVFNKKDGRAKGEKHCTQSLTSMHNLQWCNCTNCCIERFNLWMMTYAGGCSLLTHPPNFIQRYQADDYRRNVS